MSQKSSEKQIRLRLLLAILIAAAAAIMWEERAAAADLAIGRVWPAQASASQGSTFLACGEPVRKASGHMKEIVGAIDEVWNAHIRVYQSVAVAPPHARPGGCILYNPVYLNLLMRHLMIQDRAVAQAMLYAIMAHEAGHELHDDFGSRWSEISPQTRELEADRFAGYTLERLNISLDNITPYYSLAGDEFTGAQNNSSRHGDSQRRTAALKKGWELAEWNQPENYRSLSDDN